MPKLDEKKALFDASRLSAKDIREVLIESAGLRYENKTRLLQLDVVNKALSEFIKKATPQLADEMKRNLNDGSTQVRISEWLDDMRINGIEHPELWEVCAMFLMRALRGELVDARQEYPSHDESKRLMAEYLC